jgi:hypothetical protein
LRIKLDEWFGELIPPETLVQWARQHGRQGFLMAAALLNPKTERLSDSVRLLVREANNHKEVMGQLGANLGAGAIMGPISSHMEGNLTILKKWAQDEEPRIRSWAESAILHAQARIRRQRRLEEEEFV